MGVIGITWPAKQFDFSWLHLSDDSLTDGGREPLSCGP
jgi:hypothetical protein